jgi:nucleoside-diphosphate-sugar epimerase
MMSTIEEKISHDNQYDSVVVTGGAGFFPSTCQHLDERGWDVTALDLKPFNEEDAVMDAFEEADADVVVHSAAALPLWDNDEILDVTVEGIRTVLWAAKK